MEKIKQIFCGDKNNCVVVAKQNSREKWELWGLSKELETKEPVYENHLFAEHEYDDIEATYSTSGRTIIKVLQDGKWLDIVFIQTPILADDSPSQYWQWSPETNPMWLKYMSFDENKQENLEAILERGAGIKTVLIDLADALSYIYDEESIGNVRSIMDYFLKNGIDANEKDEWGNTALLYACNWKNFNIVKLLLGNGADVNAKDEWGITALINACGDGDIDVVRLLLEHGANVNDKTKDGTTALMEACSHAYSDIFNLLLEYGADANGLKYSLEHIEWDYPEELECQLEILKSVWDKDIDVNTKDRNGKTPLMRVAEIKWFYNESDSKKFEPFLKNQMELLQLLLDKGADIHATCKKEKTALHYANDYADYKSDIQKKHPYYISQFLLEKGADINAKDNTGKTALMYAVESDLKFVVEYLTNKKLHNENN